MQPVTRKKGRPKNFNGPGVQGTIQALDRALDVLDLLGRNHGMTLTEIATGLDQSAATIYRVLTTLEARSVVEAEGQSQLWHIGPMAFRLGSAFLRRSSVVERSRPVMRELMEATGETSNLGIERRGEVMFVSQVETHESIRAFFPPGTLSAMHASGIGKALLSRYSDAQFSQFMMGRALERFSAKTIVDVNSLMAEMVAIRVQGYAFDDEEKTEGMRCVAAPVLDVHGEAVAGISISGPTHRMTHDRIDEIGRLVADAAVRLSRALGAPDQPG